jgi:hypothetical protein
LRKLPDVRDRKDRGVIIVVVMEPNPMSKGKAVGTVLIGSTIMKSQGCFRDSNRRGLN